MDELVHTILDVNSSNELKFHVYSKLLILKCNNINKQEKQDKYILQPSHKSAIYVLNLHVSFPVVWLFSI